MKCQNCQCETNHTYEYKVYEETGKSSGGDTLTVSTGMGLFLSQKQDKTYYKTHVYNVCKNCYKQLTKTKSKFWNKVNMWFWIIGVPSIIYYVANGGLGPST